MISLSDAQRHALDLADLSKSPTVTAAWSVLDRAKFRNSEEPREIARVQYELEILRSLADTGWAARALWLLSQACAKPKSEQQTTEQPTGEK